MKLSLAANYDFDLVPRLRPYPVTDVYGKFAADWAGGGRPSYMGTPLTRRDLADYVSLLRRHGIGFMYLLNASCLGNAEWSRRWQKKLVRMLDWLANLGVAGVTVSTPYLLERIKAGFPQFHVRVGIYAQIDTPRRARYWQGLGADSLTIESFSINRDLAALKAIRAAVDCELHLIANHPCLPNCPSQPYHQNGFSHSSNRSNRLFIDYCFLQCTQRRLEDPSNLIKACWIRPEDTAFYEDMGYSHFKLLERGIPSAELLRRVEAYSRRSSGEDLARLIMPYGFKTEPKKQRFWFLRNFLRPGQVNPLRMKPFYRLIKGLGMLCATDHPVFRIDPDRIPADFIRRFEQGPCSVLDCSTCQYCEQIAAKAVLVDESARREHLQRIRQAREMLVSGRLWSAEAASQ
jgi:collagenase-like PrtC family protease